VVALIERHPKGKCPRRSPREADRRIKAQEGNGRRDEIKKDGRLNCSEEIEH